MILARYPTDLTDTQWTVLEPLIPPAKAGGRPRTTDMREVVNAVFYVLRGGCQWRLLPKDFPPYQCGSERWIVERTLGWLNRSRRLNRCGQSSKNFRGVETSCGSRLGVPDAQASLSLTRGCANFRRSAGCTIVCA